MGNNGNGNGTALTKFDGGMSLAALTPEQAIQRHQMLVAFIKSSLSEGRDYGIIPGTDKRSLWKPGAEKLCTMFGYSVRLVPVDVVRDWSGKEHDGEPFFFYEYRCEITHGAVQVVESYGNCSSFEKKYRFREGKRTCPKCGHETVYRSKPRQDDPPGKPMGWYCWNKKGGCGSTFAANDTTITSQKIGLVKNDEVYDLVNTIDKMAQKRALVGSTVIACNASEFFSAEFDQEDFENGALTTTPIIVEDSAEVIQAKAQAASRTLNGDQGEGLGDFGPDLAKIEETTKEVPAIDEKLVSALKMETGTGKELASLNRAQRTELHNKLVALPADKVTQAVIDLDDALVYINEHVND